MTPTEIALADTLDEVTRERDRLRGEVGKLHARARTLEAQAKRDAEAHRLEVQGLKNGAETWIRAAEEQLNTQLLRMLPGSPDIQGLGTLRNALLWIRADVGREPPQSAPEAPRMGPDVRKALVDLTYLVERTGILTLASAVSRAKKTLGATAASPSSPTPQVPGLQPECWTCKRGERDTVNGGVLCAEMTCRWEPRE